MRDRKRIGIMCALDIEISDIVAMLNNRRDDIYRGHTFHLGTIKGIEVVLIKCGIGKVNAARGAQMLIDRYEVDVLLNSGIAGGLSPRLSISDVVLGSKLVHHDFDVTAFGYAAGNMCMEEDSDKPTVFKADEEIISELMKAATKVTGSEEKVRCGNIASGDKFVASSEDKRRIYEQFAADAVEMEGAAVAQTAYYAGVPFAVIRVISDLADGTAPESYNKFDVEAAKLSAAVIYEFIVACACN